MNGWIKAWFTRQLEVRAFARRSDIPGFALRFSAIALVLACAMNVLSHLAIDSLGWLPYPVMSAITIGVALTVVIAFPVTYALAYTIGLAVYQLSISRDEYERLSRTDMLSGLLNRRAFIEEFEKASEAAALAIFDIDRFKSINDRFGHQAGDDVIRHVAGAISEVFDGGHTVARIGGEEFAVIVHAISRTERTILVDRARETIAIRSVDIDGVRFQVTVSGGIADIENGRSRSSVYAAADRALYLAKAAGRNRVLHEADADSLAGAPAPANEPDAKDSAAA